MYYWNRLNLSNLTTDLVSSSESLRRPALTPWQAGSSPTLVSFVQSTLQRFSVYLSTLRQTYSVD